MTYLEIRSKLSFKDVSDEKIRTYLFPGGNLVVIENPIGLYVSKSGGHRLVTAAGESIYVAPGWISFRFGPVDSARDHWLF